MKELGLDNRHRDKDRAEGWGDSAEARRHIQRATRKGSREKGEPIERRFVIWNCYLRRRVIHPDGMASLWYDHSFQIEEPRLFNQRFRLSHRIVHWLRHKHEAILSSPGVA
jgi:hypothetical protein